MKLVRRPVVLCEECGTPAGRRRASTCAECGAPLPDRHLEIEAAVREAPENAARRTGRPRSR